MKKYLVLALALVMVLALAACGDKSSTTPQGNGNNNESTVPSESSTPSGSDSTATPPTTNTSSKPDDKWPDNEWTEQVPKPPFIAEGSVEIGADLTISFSDATFDTVKAYIDELIANGFIAGSDATASGDDISWFGTNADGWRVSVTSLNEGNMVITKPQ